MTEEQHQYMLSQLPKLREIILTSNDAKEVMKVVAQIERFQKMLAGENTKQ